VSVTAYHSFAGEVEASNISTIRRLILSRRHQLSPIARPHRIVIAELIKVVAVKVIVAQGFIKYRNFRDGPKLALRVYRLLLHGPEPSEPAKTVQIAAAQGAALRAAMAERHEIVAVEGIHGMHRHSSTPASR
jgi:hypothetical protein